MFKQAILAAHPVGSIYESTDPTSPAVLFGGTWEEMEAGRVLVSAGTASTGTVYNAGVTGGEESHQLTEQELPKVTVTSTGTTNKTGGHNHGFTIKAAVSRTGYGVSASDGADNDTYLTGWAGEHTHTVTVSGTFGGGQPHNNMQPYEVIRRWKRTA